MLAEIKTLLLFASLHLLLSAYALSSCECGHTVNLGGLGPATLLTSSFESNFLNTSTFEGSGNWRAQIFNKSKTASRGPYGEMFSSGNILAKSSLYSPGLQLVVGSKIVDGMIPTAEIATTRSDFFYGSYRASIKLSRDRGTCAAFYWSFDYVRRVFPVNIVLHSAANLDPDYDAAKGGTWEVKNLPFDPTESFHEYRFDWSPGHVTFYADNQGIGRMSGDAVPSHPGYVLLSHWSNGDEQWSGGPPPTNASMAIRYINIYFNSTDETRQASWQSRCTGSPLPPNAVCRTTSSKVGGNMSSD